MKIKILLYPFLTILLFNLSFAEDKKEKNYLHIVGKIDPRLTVSFVSWYRSTNLNNSNCTMGDWNTASQRPLLDVYGEVIRNKSNFDLKIPIDYPKVDKHNCGYTYTSTEMEIRRLNDNKWYSGYTLLSKKAYAYHNPRVNNVYTGVEGVKNGHTKKKHYFIGKDLTFNCITKSYPSLDSISYYCKPKEADWSNGVDEFKNLDMNLDIRIDESGGERFKYVPYKMTFKEKFLKWFNELKK
jgi:hypothetical protein